MIPRPGFTWKRSEFKTQRMAVLVLLACQWLPSTSYALYKVVGPDGKVSYTDRPETQTPAQVTTLSAPADTSSNSTLQNLPFSLRSLAQKYPVVLYSAKDCSPCDQGRSMLKQRGVPFSERLIANSADSDALQKLTGARNVPVMAIGSQVNQGFDADVWVQYLDAAGYPSTSQLPRNYVFSAAQPLTSVAAAAAGKAASAPRPNPPRPAPPPKSPSGLQF